MERRLIIILVSFGIAASASAQDPHMTQFDASPVILNPARTGMLEEDLQYRSAAQFRSQWGTVTNNSFTSTTLAFDMPMKKRWGVGGYLMNNDAPRVYNAFNFVLSGAYQIMDPGQDKHSLSTGLQLGLIYKKTKKKDLVFDRQYSNGVFNQNLPSGEDLEQQSRLMPEINFGIDYEMTEESKRVRPYGGFSLFHITTPNEALLANTEKSPLPRRYVLNGGGIVDVIEYGNLEPKFLVMRQGNIMEYLYGLHASYQFQNEHKTKLLGGTGYRIGDAAYFMLGVDHKDLQFRMNYDANTSTLERYSNGNGAWEFSVVFLR